MKESTLNAIPRCGRERGQEVKGSYIQEHRHNANLYWQIKYNSTNHVINGNFGNKLFTRNTEKQKNLLPFLCRMILVHNADKNIYIFCNISCHLFSLLSFLKTLTKKIHIFFLYPSHIVVLNLNVPILSYDANIQHTSDRHASADWSQLKNFWLSK